MTAQPKSTAYDAVRDTSIVMVDPAVGFARNVVGLAAAYAAKQDAWILDQLMKQLDEVLP